MEDKFFSLIYPDEAEKYAAASGENIPDISEKVCDELGLSDMLGLAGFSASSFFTLSENVIKYRQETFSDVISVPELSSVLNGVLPILFDIKELRRLDSESEGKPDSYLYGIAEIELYISAVDTLYKGLSEIGDKISGRAFLRLADIVKTLADSDYYRELNEKLKELSSRVREIRSITVGVNLDAELRPCEAGVISVNSEKFKSGKVLDKILRLSFKNDAYTCIAPLVPFGIGESDNKKEALVGAFNRAMLDVFRSSVKEWRKITEEYVLDNADFLIKILPEIEFVTKGGDLIRRLMAKGYPVCMPVLEPKDSKAFSAKGLYNPDVALRIKERVVDNDFGFDDNGMIYILSGPNRGGKSVITCALGLAQAMFQLGLPVAAENVRISVCDGIYTHFPQGAEDTIDKGRLGEECARLREILDEVSEYSMILLDESLSSTGAYEASYIAAELLAGFGAVGCRGIFSTHLHELASYIDDINSRSLSCGGVRIDTLVAGIYEGKRSFKILRTKPEGHSYASDIANRYGLSFAEIKKRIGR